MLIAGVGSAFIAATTLGRALFLRYRNEFDHGGPIVLAIMAIVGLSLAVGAFVYATTPEVPDRAPSRSAQAVQSAAVVAGIGGATVTLWLTNMRRAHDEKQLNLTRRRDRADARAALDELALTRQRIDEERFGKAVELLGDSSGAVRIGAMYTLHDLARADGRRKQTVINVLAAYLRLPALRDDVDDEASSGISRDVRAGEDSVRATALSALVSLLPARGSDEPELLVDLTGAQLGRASFEGVRVRLVAPRATFREHATFKDAAFAPGSTFTGATFVGNAWMEGVLFESIAWLNQVDFQGIAFMRSASFAGEVRMMESTFHGECDLTEARVEGQAQIVGAVFEGRLSLRRVHSVGHLALGDFTALRKLELQGAQIDGNLTLRKAALLEGISLEGTHIAGSLIASGTRIDGDVVLSRSRIGGNVSLAETHIPRGKRVLASGATLKGMVHLPKGMVLTGIPLEVRRRYEKLIGGEA